jgi:hypothetical protein
MIEKLKGLPPHWIEVVSGDGKTRLVNLAHVHEVRPDSTGYVRIVFEKDHDLLVEAASFEAGVNARAALQRQG